MAYVVSVFKNGCKEDPGNDRPVSLISVPDKIMEKFILGVTEKTHKTQLSHWSEIAQV